MPDGETRVPSLFFSFMQVRMPRLVKTGIPIAKRDS